jgi:hypothetical protein
MMQSPYDIGFGAWGLWFGASVVKLLILGGVAWLVVSILRHRDTHADRGRRFPSKDRTAWSSCVALRHRDQSRRCQPPTQDSPAFRRTHTRVRATAIEQTPGLA